MKRFYIIGLLIIICTIVVGLCYRQTCTNVDFNDDKFLDEQRILGRYREEMFIIELPDENIDNNMYEVDPDTGEIIEVIEGDDGEIIEYDVTPLDQEIRNNIEVASSVVVAKRIGNIECVTNNCQHTLKIVDVKKGDKNLVGKSVDAYLLNALYCDTICNAVGIGARSNLIQKDREYLIFMNESKHDNVYEIVDGGYFPVEAMKHEVIKDADNIVYKDVKDYEFFAEDELSLERMVALREEMMEKYMGEE